MSIINEALKKAERERTHIPRGIPSQRAVIRRRPRWIRIAIVGGLALVSIAGGSRVLGWLLREAWHIAPVQQAHIPVPVATSPEDTTTAATNLPVSPPADGIPPRAWEPVSDRPPAPQMPPWSRAAAEAAYQRAVKAESKGAWKEAVRDYEEAIALDRTLLEARTNLGNLYVRQNRLPAALEQFQAASAIEPQYAVAHNNLGSVHLLMGNEALAVQEFLAAIRLDAQYASPYYNLASLFARRGDVDRAISFLTKAIARDPAVLTWVREDPDFARLRELQEFRRIVAHAR